MTQAPNSDIGNNIDSSSNDDKPFFDAHPLVFPFSAGLIVLFVLFAVIFPGRALILFNWLQEQITLKFGWLYIVSMTGFLVFALWLCLSKYGGIRRGYKGQRPEFPTLTWFAMLFSAGMGIALSVLRGTRGSFAGPGPGAGRW
jgi:choline/glycine/proline betaine transport protein